MLILSVEIFSLNLGYKKKGLCLREQVRGLATQLYLVLWWKLLRKHKYFWFCNCYFGCIAQVVMNSEGKFIILSFIWCFYAAQWPWPSYCKSSSCRLWIPCTIILATVLQVKYDIKLEANNPINKNHIMLSGVCHGFVANCVCV